jgi:hypothetical protein
MDLIRQTPRPEIVLSELAGEGASINMTIDSVITSDYGAIGPGAEYLAKTFCVTRNAEHDQAVSVRRHILAGVSAGKVTEQLRRDAAGLDFPYRPDSVLYYKVRRRQADVLLRAINNAPWDQFLDTLGYLRSQPKTRLRLVSTAFSGT